MQDYFDILRDDMLVNYKAAQKRITKIEGGKMSPLPHNLLPGETNKYYTTVLCFDIVKYSVLTRTGTDNLNAALLLNSIVPTVMKVFSDFNGITVTSSGDQLTSLFGLESREASTYAKTALRAALYVTNFIDHIASQFIGQMLPHGLRCSIGIDQGPVHITCVGRPGMKTLVPLGPPVHIAKNLHFLAGDNEIWVGENFINSLDAEFVETYFTDANVKSWPWISMETGEAYRAYRFVE